MLSKSKALVFLSVSIIVCFIISAFKTPDKKVSVFKRCRTAGKARDQFDLTINPIYKFDSTALINLLEIGKAEFYYNPKARRPQRDVNEIKLRILKNLGGESLQLHNTFFVGDNIYSPIYIDDSTLTMVQKYYLSHILRDLLFIDVDKILNEDSVIQYSDSKYVFMPLNSTVCDFNIVYFKSSRNFILNNKTIVIAYLKMLYSEILHNDIDTSSSFSTDDNLLKAINKLQGKVYIDPM